MDSDRFLVALGYHGHAFHGSQVQPDVRTVEGSLIQALRRLTWWGDGCLEMSSRTDAGVSVRMSLARIDLPASVSRSVSDARITSALNDNLPVGMVVLAARRAPSDSKIRYAESRRYLYRLEAVEGRHDFTNLSRPEEGRDPMRTVDECVPWCAGDGRPVGFSIRARSFLWNQVRRIASAISGVASGRVSLTDLESALSRPSDSIDLGRAPADGLVLWETYHSDFDALASDELPDASTLSTRPGDPREYRRWLSMAGYEMSALLEREWSGRLS